MERHGLSRMVEGKYLIFKQMNNIPFLSLKDVTAVHCAEINETMRVDWRAEIGINKMRRTRDVCIKYTEYNEQLFFQIK